MNPELQKLILIRDFVESDRNFVMATFLRGLYYGDTWFGLVPKNIFMDNYKHIAARLVDSSTIKIACLRDDPDTIVGYSILSDDFQTVHWCKVKTAWCKKGIGRALVPQHPTAITHLNDLGRQLMTKLPTAHFNPFWSPDVK